MLYVVPHIPTPFSQVSFLSSLMTAHLLGIRFHFSQRVSVDCHEAPDPALKALCAVEGHSFVHIHTGATRCSLPVCT